LYEFLSKCDGFGLGGILWEYFFLAFGFFGGSLVKMVVIGLSEILGK
jgi:hypothetical protein